MALLIPTYFPNVATYSAIIKTNKLIFEVCDNYQKQTLRNRTYISSANGKLLLSIPVKFTQKKRQLSSEIYIDHSEKWGLRHWKSIQSAYSNSPFYEHYCDELKPLFEQKEDLLLTHNIKCITQINKCLDIEKPFYYSKSFEKETKILDLRAMAIVKNTHEIRLKNYLQVFESKHGFISNLSILDLLFNEGPNSLNYLKNMDN